MTSSLEGEILRWTPIGILIGALVTAACGQTSTSTATGPSPLKCAVSLTRTENPVDATGATRVVTITTQPECAWNAAAEVNWITELSPATGQGNGEVRFRVLPNPEGRMREGAVAVNDQRLQVRQNAAACLFDLETSRQQFTAGSASATVSITTPDGCPWTASSGSSWIVLSTSSGSGNARVTFQVARNVGAARRGTITIGDTVVSVSQAASSDDDSGEAPSPTPTPTPGSQSCATSLQPSSASVPAAGGSQTVAVTSPQGCEWTATSQASWITITDGASGNGRGSVTFGVTANTGPARSGTLRIASQAFTVNQSDGCTYSISSANVTIAGAGGTSTVGVSASSSCSWTATSNAGWITITSGTSGTGNGTVAFSTPANTSSPRTGTLSIAGQTFTVTQLVVCTYSISPTNSAITHFGGTGTVTVTAPTGCAWTATSNAGWISITSGSSSSGNGTVAFRVDGNSESTRTGTLTIAGNTFTVTQMFCSYTLNRTEQSVTAVGGAFSVSLSTAAGCPWAATSKVSWITVTAGANNTGSGSVGYLVLPNVGGARTGTLTIDGQSFTVTQAALLGLGSQ